MNTDKLTNLFSALAAALNTEPDTGTRLAAIKAVLAAVESQQALEITTMLMRSQMGDNLSGGSGH